MVELAAGGTMHSYSKRCQRRPTQLWHQCADLPRPTSAPPTSKRVRKVEGIVLVEQHRNRAGGEGGLVQVLARLGGAGRPRGDRWQAPLQVCIALHTPKQGGWELSSGTQLGPGHASRCPASRKREVKCAPCANSGGKRLSAAGLAPSLAVLWEARCPPQAYTWTHKV